MYDTFVIDIREELDKFIAALSEIDMPSFDPDAALSRIFDCFVKEENCLTKLEEVCIDMSEQDGLFENEQLDNHHRERVYRAVFNIGMKIKHKYDHIKPYVDGILPYSYKRIFNGCAIIVADVPTFGYPARNNYP